MRVGRSATGTKPVGGRRSLGWGGADDMVALRLSRPSARRRPGGRVRIPSEAERTSREGAPRGQRGVRRGSFQTGRAGVERGLPSTQGRRMTSVTCGKPCGIRPVRCRHEARLGRCGAVTAKSFRKKRWAWNQKSPIARAHPYQGCRNRPRVLVAACVAQVGAGNAEIVVAAPRWAAGEVGCFRKVSEKSHGWVMARMLQFPNPPDAAQWLPALRRDDGQHVPASSPKGAASRIDHLARLGMTSRRR